MSLKEKLQSDLTDAIRARDEMKSGTIRMVLAAITTEEVAGKEARKLSDDEVITVLSREAKKRREAAEAFEQGGRSSCICWCIRPWRYGQSNGRSQAKDCRKSRGWKSIRTR